MFSLPIPEDIYDLDTFSLEDLSSQLPLELQKKSDDPTFLKKAKKIMDLIELELNERKMVENFGNFCINLDNNEKSDQKNKIEESYNKKNATGCEIPNTQLSQSKKIYQKEAKNAENPFIKKTDSNRTPPKNNEPLANQDKYKNYMDFQEYEEMEEKKDSSNKKSVPPSSGKKKNVSGSPAKESISVNFAKEKFRFIPSTQKSDKMLNFMREVLSQTKIQQNVVMIGKAAGGKYKTKLKKKKKVDDEGMKKKERGERKDEEEGRKKKDGFGRMTEIGGERKKEGGKVKKGEGEMKKEGVKGRKEDGNMKKEGKKKEGGDKEVVEGKEKKEKEGGRNEENANSKTILVFSKENQDAKVKEEDERSTKNNYNQENKLEKIIETSNNENNKNLKEKEINKYDSDFSEIQNSNIQQNANTLLINYNNEVKYGFNERKENEPAKLISNCISTAITNETNSYVPSLNNYDKANLAQSNKANDSNNPIKTIYNQNSAEILINANEDLNGVKKTNFDQDNSSVYAPNQTCNNKGSIQLNLQSFQSNNSVSCLNKSNVAADSSDSPSLNSNNVFTHTSNNTNLAQTNSINGSSAPYFSNEEQTTDQNILDFQAKYRDSVSQPVKFTTCLNNIEELEESYAESAGENQSTTNLPSVSEAPMNAFPSENKNFTTKSGHQEKEIASSSFLPGPPSSSSSLPPPLSSFPPPTISFPPSSTLSKNHISSSNLPPPSSSHPLPSDKKKINNLESKNTLKNSKQDLQNTLQKYQPSKKEKKKPPIPQSSLPPPLSRSSLPPPPPAKLSPLFSMPEEEIVDYSDFYPSFNSIISFSYVHDPQPNLDLVGVMKEICLIFHQHVQKIDRLDKLLNKYRPTLAPLELNANDRLFLNDNKNISLNPAYPLPFIHYLFLSYYAYQTNLDLQSFLARQKTFEARIAGQLLEAPEKTLFFRVIKNREEVYDIITKSFLRKENWVELMHGEGLKTSWNLIWTWSKPQIDMGKLVTWQKVNHFPMNKNMVRKDLLKKNIEKIQRLGPKTANFFNFIPLTFVLPKEYCQFMEEFYKGIALEGNENIWIMKPIGKSRGRGISLVNDISKVVYAEQVILQKYLKNPLLLRGLKFDLRIYVLVTSLHPLEAFIYKEGFGRLSTVPFSLDPETLDKQFIHLTNYSIQKNNMNMKLLNENEAIFGGSKISLKTVKSKVEERGYCWARIWTQIQEIAVKTLLACQSEIPKNSNCFELFGFDVIIDDEGKCWLLEVNSSPSLSREYILDDIVKQQLIDDTIDLVDPILFDRERLVEVLERRIKEDMGVKSAINTHNNSKQMLNRDLTYILRGKLPRKIGEMPKKIGNYERIAPSEFCDKVNKIIQSYKCPNTKNYATIDY